MLPSTLIPFCFPDFVRLPPLELLGFTYFKSLPQIMTWEKEILTCPTLLKMALCKVLWFYSLLKASALKMQVQMNIVEEQANV